MGAVKGFNPPTQFSSCSLSDFNTLVSRGGDSCLFNTPSTIIGDPVCGNSIREGNEICDCGSAAECTDPCCNAATCQLVAGAECPAGACCNNCQFRSYGTECNKSVISQNIAQVIPTNVLKMITSRMGSRVIRMLGIALTVSVQHSQIMLGVSLPGLGTQIKYPPG